LLANQRVTFLQGALLTALVATAAAIITVLVDSIMWGRWLWPEFEVLWLNTAENKSGEWGTSPPLWYFYSALPRALLGAAPLAVLGVILERRARVPMVVASTFVTLYSFLPHKELRFLFPVLPLFNVAAAAAVARLLRMKGVVRLFAQLTLVGLAIGTLLATAIMTVASVTNYPGGVAMAGLHATEPVSPAISVHIGNLAAISGVSRFLEAHPGWRYSKEEGLSVDVLANRGFDRLLTEVPEVPGYACKAAVNGYDRLVLGRIAGLPILPTITKKPQVYVLSKTEDHSTVPCGSDAEVWN